MKYFLLFNIIFAVSCSLSPISQSQIDNYWINIKYTPLSSSTIEGIYKSNALGYMGETLILFPNSTFHLHVWHSRVEIGNYNLFGQFKLSNDTIMLEYLSYKIDSTILDNFKKDTVSLEEMYGNLISSNDYYVFRKVDSSIFIIQPTAKNDFCKAAIIQKYLYNNVDSLQVGRFYMLKVQ